MSGTYRTKRDELGSSKIQVVVLWGEVVFGASGAVSSSSGDGWTMTKPSGTGLYRFTMDDKWEDVLGLHVLHNDNSTPADVGVWLQEEDFATNDVLDVTHFAAGSAADVTSGHSVKFGVVLRGSDV